MWICCPAISEKYSLVTYNPHLPNYHVSQTHHARFAALHEHPNTHVDIAQSVSRSETIGEGR